MKKLILTLAVVAASGSIAEASKIPKSLEKGISRIIPAVRTINAKDLQNKMVKAIENTKAATDEALAISIRKTGSRSMFIVKDEVISEKFLNGGVFLEIKVQTTMGPSGSKSSKLVVSTDTQDPNTLNNIKAIFGEEQRWTEFGAMNALPIPVSNENMDDVFRQIYILAEKANTNQLNQKAAVLSKTRIGPKGER